MNCNTYFDKKIEIKEAICLMETKINEIVEMYNRVNADHELIAAKVKELEALMNYLLGAGLGAEVKKKLEEWLANGTLAGIIGDTLDKWTERISNVENDITEINSSLDSIAKTLLIQNVNTGTLDFAPIINKMLEDSVYLSFQGLKEVIISSPIVIKQPNTVLDLCGCKIIPSVSMESVITTECSIGKHIYNVIIQNGEIDCDYKSNYGIYTKKSYKTTIRNIRVDKYKTGIKINDENIPNGNDYGYSYETLVDNVVCGIIEQVPNSVGIEVTASDSWIINSVFGGEIGLWSHDNAVNFYSNIHNWNTGQKIGFMFQNTVGNIMCNIEADDSLECGLVINNEYNTIQNYIFQVGANTHYLGNTLGTTAIKILQGYNFIDGMTVIVPTNAQIDSIFANIVPNCFNSKNVTLKGLLIRNQGVIKNGTLYKECNDNTFSTGKYYSVGWKRILKFDADKFATLDGWNQFTCGRWIGKIIGDEWAVDNVNYAEIIVSFAPQGISESGVKILNSSLLSSSDFKITTEGNIAYLEIQNNTGRKEHYHIIPSYNIGVEEIRAD